MEVDDNEYGSVARPVNIANELDEFARALEQSRGQLGAVDVLDMYQSIAREKAKLSYDVDQTEFENEELESRLWSLVKALYGYRLQRPEPSLQPVHEFNGDAVVQEEYLRKTPKSRELWIIVGWLQESIPDPKEPSDLRSSKWLYTKSELKRLRLQKFGGVNTQTHAPRRSSVLAPRPEKELITYLDADAPIRESRGLAKDDEDTDHELYKYVFELLLGNRIDEALRACEMTGNWTLKLAIRGIYGHVDAEIDAPLLGLQEDNTQGIERKALWRRMCYEMAKQQTSIDKYERGVYGLLSCDLSSVLDLCDTWESQLLAYLSHMLAEDSERPLAMTGRLEPEMNRLDVPHTRLNSPHMALDVLAHSTNPVVKAQSENYLRTLIGAVINDSVDWLMDQLAHEIRSMMEGATNEQLQNAPYVVRVTTHLILYLRGHGKSVGTNDSVAVVVRAYIEILCHEGKSHLVPLYLSYLPEDIANATYSSLLAGITDTEERKQHLELGKRYKLDMENMVRLAVDRVLQQNSEIYESRPVGSLVQEMESPDWDMIKAVEWYVNAGLLGDALHAAVFLFRRFLTSGRVEAAKQLGTSIPLATILKKYDAVASTSSSIEKISDSNRAEVMEYDRFIQCLNTITEWNTHYAELVATAGPTPSIKSASQAWSTRGLAIVDKVSKMVNSLCDDWLVVLLSSEYFEQGDADWIQVEHIRCTFVPHLLLELARILTEAQVVHHKFLKQAVELANKVADEKSKLYEYFTQGYMLEPFIKRITLAFTDGIAKGQSGIYDP